MTDGVSQVQDGRVIVSVEGECKFYQLGFESTVADAIGNKLRKLTLLSDNVFFVRPIVPYSIVLCFSE